MRYFVIIIVFALLTAVSCNNTVLKKEKTPAPLPIVDLYTTDWCIWCTRAEAFLIDNKIKYTRYDIETQKGYNRLVSEATRISYSGDLGAIPTFIIGKKIIIGYDPIEVLYTLKRIEVQQTCTTNKKLYHKNFSMVDPTKIRD